MKTLYAATVRLLLSEDVTNEGEAVDAISGLLSEYAMRQGAITDWSYLRIGDNYQLPEAVTVCDDYSPYDDFVPGAYLSAPIEAAAAPDMLAEIRHALELLDNVTAHTDNDSDYLGQAENALHRAIAKAEGKAMQAIAREALGRTADSGIADKIELAFRSGYACGMDHGSDEGHEDGCDGAWLDQQSVLLPKKAL
jgi:hypothetical protein